MINADVLIPRLWSTVPTTSIARAHDTADQLFERHASVFGPDLPVYRGHVHRVIGVVGLQCDVPADVAVPLGVAGFFHDAGIWFDGTWDYLPPSVRRAAAELGEADQPHAELVSSLISEHHRLRRARHDDPLVEAFRRADLTDVSAGLIPAPGVSRDRYRELTSVYPANGFRPMLLKAFGRGLREAPLRPAPMIKL
ncbi:MAG: hypothetical protein QOE32_5681 [Pseudonocardiales bacterium]|jgi:hypothetical protein|nr:hypothetical protein [Pseudonocardiales bacterium]MDT7625936.1 hypothetical protein [Pseudonocardiales bacterium]MDT7674142.1 hypothetical protein [Pseudonocardiales bacterium]